MSDELKRQAALTALGEIREGMVVGLGSGSTAAIFIRELGARVTAGLKVVGISTSEASSRIAAEVGIPLTSFREHPVIDVTVDGADEVSPDLDLIKGLGGALVREKIVARASTRVVIVVDDAKLVDHLGSRSVIPVEVVPLAAGLLMRQLLGWGGEPLIRLKDGNPFVTDNGNLIIDWNHGPIDQPLDLERRLKQTTGIVDSGLFCGIAHSVIVAGSSGVRTMFPTRA